MSMAMGVRLVLGLICAAVLSHGSSGTAPGGSWQSGRKDEARERPALPARHQQLLSANDDAALSDPRCDRRRCADGGAAYAGGAAARVSGDERLLCAPDGHDALAAQMGFRPRVRDALAAAGLAVCVRRQARPAHGRENARPACAGHARVCAAGCLGRGRGGRDGPEDRVAPCIPPPDSEKRRSGHGSADAACLGDRAGTCVDPEMQVEARALQRGHDAAVYRSV